MIAKDSWKIIELKIRRYPEKKRQYEEYISDIMSNTSVGEIVIRDNNDGSRPQSITEAKALKMTSVYMERLKKEIEAIEFVYNNLKPEEQKVMRIRYWSDRIRVVPYLKMSECSYSERQMKRIVFKIISQVGRYIGEIQ